MRSNQAAIVGFFSFKGGVGRTAAAVHTAYFLKLFGQRVLLVDADLEAPGVSHWNGSMAATEPPQNGLLQLLLAIGNSDPRSRSGTSQDTDNHAAVAKALGARTSSAASSCVERFLIAGDFFVNTPLPRDATAETQGVVRLLPSGRGVSATDLGRYLEGLPQAQATLTTRVEDLQWLFANSGFDVVVVDNRTGLSSTGAASFQSLSEFHVIVFGPGRQNFMGLITLLQALTPQQIGQSVFAMSPVPQMGFSRLDEAREAIKLAGRGELPRSPRVIPILWHVSLASEEQLLPETDPLCDTARNYRQLFLELQTVRGYGVDYYRSRVNALLDLYKWMTYRDREMSDDTLGATFGVAFARESRESLATVLAQALSVRKLPDDLPGHEKADLILKLLLWELVASLTELYWLHREASEAVWGLAIVRSHDALEEVIDRDWWPGRKAAHRGLLWILVQEFNDLFEQDIDGLGRLYARPTGDPSSLKPYRVGDLLSALEAIS